MHENKNGQDKDDELNIKQPLDDIIKEKKIERIEEKIDKK